MSDEFSDHQAVLRPVIARLKEIERKCDSMGSRNEEFPLMKERVSSIISRLDAGAEPDGEPLDYRSMARELFPVAHIFESVGFMSIGKEIAHIERTLSELSPETEAPEVRQERAASSSALRPDPTDTAGDHVLDRHESDDGGGRTPVPVPVIVGLIILATAIAAAIAVVTGVGPFGGGSVVTEEQPSPIPATPTPPPPTPTSTPAPVSDEVSASARFGDEIARARLAIRRGDIEGAANHLSVAASIDHTDADVQEISNQLLLIYVQDADRAAVEARWADAESLLEQARRTAIRYGLATDSIDAAARRQAAMERFQVVGPNQTGVLRANIGKRVELRMTNGVTRTGTIGGISQGNFLLEVADNVGGGLVHYTDELPLSKIQTVKIFEK